MTDIDKMDFCGELCLFAEELIEKAKPSWIPISERLPEDELPSSRKQIKVLTAVKMDNGTYTVRSQLRFREWYGNRPWSWKYSAGEVTHWMPLPEPPKVNANDA